MENFNEEETKKKLSAARALLIRELSKLLASHSHGTAFGTTSVVSTQEDFENKINDLFSSLLP